MGVTLTDVLLFGKAQSDDVDNATLVIYRRNILRWSALGGYLDIIVKGVSPISLPDAIANSLSYVKAFGGTEQNGTPTPDAPVDIVSNNGVIKFGQYGKNLNVGELSNQGYSSTGGISTSATLCGTLWKIKVNPGEKYTVSYGNFPDGISGMYISTWLADGTWNSRQAASFSGSYTYTIPAGVGEVNFTLYKTGGATIADNSWIQVEAGETATDYEPAHFGLHTDGTVETINVHGKNLFDGVIELGSINPADGSLVVNNSRTRSANFIPVQPNTTYTFTRENSAEIRWIVGYDKDKNGITDGTPNQPAALTNLNSSSVMSKTFTTTPTTHYIKWYDTSNAGLNEKVQIEVGSTATDYEPYYNGGTATAEMLLKVDDTYQDQQEIITGAVTRKVGIRVLDGSETWTYNASLSKETYSAFWAELASDKKENVAVLCSHFVGKQNQIYISAVNQIGFHRDAPYAGRCYITLDKDTYQQDGDKVNQFFAEQYAAGTPVIVIYPLATATTESVAGQALQVQAGDNTIEITQASLDNLELEAKYQAAVSLTIQEVQDANLDPNVQVTIN